MIPPSPKTNLEEGIDTNKGGKHEGITDLTGGLP